MKVEVAIWDWHLLVPLDLHPLDVSTEKDLSFEKELMIDGSFIGPYNDSNEIRSMRSVLLESCHAGMHSRHMIDDSYLT